MSTFTEHYKLVKPSYDEDIDIQVINNNMDALDNTINGLDFVQTAFTNDSGLHLNKRDGSIVDIPLDYLKLTGGNVTGDITVNDAPVVYIVDTVTTDTQTSVKLSNGTLIQYGTIDNTGTVNIMLTYTFATPFIDSSYLVFTTINGDRWDAEGAKPNTSLDISAYISRAKKTPTSCVMQCDDWSLGINVLAIGKWK